MKHDAEFLASLACKGGLKNISNWLCLWFALVFISPAALADGDAVNSADGPGMVTSIVLVEGLVATVSYLATLDPTIYGAVGGALVGQQMYKGYSNTSPWWVGFISMEGLMIYNIAAFDRKKIDGKNVFLTNFIGWNVIGALVYLSVQQQPKSYFSIVPTFNATSKQYGVQAQYTF